MTFARAYARLALDTPNLVGNALGWYGQGKRYLDKGLVPALAERLGTNA